MKKKVRVRKAADEEGAGLDLAALEAEAAAGGTSELGSRKQAASREAQAQQAQVADEARRQSKYAVIYFVLHDPCCQHKCCDWLRHLCCMLHCMLTGSILHLVCHAFRQGDGFSSLQHLSHI